jgi:methylmalonyl-CoA/ethylmalonyl-CoA epimerase
MPSAASSLPHLVFHHFGLAVRRPDEAKAFLSLLGYRIGEPVFDSAQNVHLLMGTHATEPAVEIIWPGDSHGPVTGLIDRHTSGIIYHVCYETDDLTAALAGCESAGLRPRCVSPPKPAPLFGGRPVSFYNVIGLGLVEILE